jgi:hypothetical protein
MSFDDAVATFAAVGRLVEHDASGAIVRVAGEEKVMGRAALCTAAQMVDVETAPVYEPAPEYEGPEQFADVTEESALLELDQVCEKHAAQLVGWEEDWCPICHALDEAVHNVWAGIYEAAFCTEVNSTINGQEQSTQTEERTRTMKFHNCPVTKKHTWAGEDGFCKHCRGVEAVAQILDRPVEEVIHTPEGEIKLTQEDVEEINAPMLADLIEEIGGETALMVSIEVVRRAKKAGKRGDSVDGRKTRQLLDLIGQQPQVYQGALLEEYREYLAPYGIGLDTHTERDDQGEEHLVAYHDYSALKASQPAIPQLVPALNEVKGLSGDALRRYLVQAEQNEKRAHKAAQRAVKRAESMLVMHWVKKEGRKVVEEGRKTLGAYTDEIKAQAAEYQAAGKMKGYNVTFQLV